MLLDIWRSLITNINSEEVQRLFKKLVNANRKSLLLLLWMFLVPLLTSSALTWLAFDLENHFVQLNWLDLAWPYLISCFTMALALTPTTFIALLSGFFIGLKSLPWLVGSYQVASFIGYTIAKKVDHGSFRESTQFYPQAIRMLNRINDDPLTLVILARISPVLPFAIMNVVLSMARVRLLPFLWGGLWGMLPRTLLFVWVGTQAAVLVDLLQQRTENRVIMTVTIALLIVSVFGLYLYFIKLWKKSRRVSS